METDVEAIFVDLPRPVTIGKRSLERVIFTRRSLREYSEQALMLTELGQLLWSSQGITSKDNLRAAPSAGATYPLEIYAVVQNVKGLVPGVYHYLPGPGLRKHRLELVHEGNVAAQICQLTSKQDFIREVPVNIVLAAVEQRTRKEYGDMAPRLVLLEAGHAAQNIHLQAEALGLGSVAIGYVNATKVGALLQTEAEPLYMVSVGRKRRQ